MKIDKNTFHFCPFCGQKLINRKVDHRQRKTCPICNFTDYRNAKPTGGALILNDKQEILLAKRAFEPGKGKWNIPGGYLEEAEHPVAGIIREIKEETGLIARPYQYFDSYIGHLFHETQGLETSLNIYYLTELKPGCMRASDDTTELAYYSLKSLPEMASDFEAQMLRDLKKYLK